MNRYEFLTVDIADGIAAIRMDRPPLNVLHNAMMADFNAALESVLSDGKLAALVIRAAGKAFSAGVDVADHSAEKVGEMIHQFHGIFRRLAATDALTIAAVQGAALGGGCELACFCDIVLASDRAKFGQPEVQVGVFPPVAAAMLPLQVGLKKAVELAALGAAIDAGEAHRIGLVNQVYPASEFETAVDNYLAGIRKLSRPVVRLAKRATTLPARQQILAHLQQNETLYMQELMQLTDSHEGIAAFLEKRAPQWIHG
ncbi:MAG: enoyl-CoA hydratase/isomerase family protein [Planctomycetes bacterium]|nr:enoyl-CoA hydratase/isomerase family protein [Planctomycetota bacterium]